MLDMTGLGVGLLIGGACAVGYGIVVVLVERAVRTRQAQAWQFVHRARVTVPTRREAGRPLNLVR